MTPTLSTNNLPNRCLGNSKPAGERSLGFAIFVRIPNLLDLVILKLRASIFDASSWILALPSLFDHVFRVVRSRPEEQVVRVAAGWIVARVKNTKASRDFAFLQLPRNAMSALLSAIKIKLPVSSMRFVAEPRPAFIATTLINFAPESFELIPPSFFRAGALMFRRVPNILSHCRIKSNLWHSFKLNLWPIH